MFPRIGRGGLAADFNAICCANSCERLCAVPLMVKGIERHRTNAPHQEAGQRSVVGSHTPFVLCACASQTAAHGTCSAMQWLCHPKLCPRPTCPALPTGSVELSWEEIKHVCASYGLDIVREERQDSTYNADRRSMMKTAYSGVLCSAVKRSKPIDEGK